MSDEHDALKQIAAVRTTEEALGTDYGPSLDKCIHIARNFGKDTTPAYRPMSDPYPQDTPVLVWMENDNTKRRFPAVLVYQNEYDDPDESIWRTADDGSEVDLWNWTLLGWQAITPFGEAS